VTAPEVALDAVSVVYHQGRRGTGDLTALRGVSLSVMPGEILGLAGPNGAGKTTLLEVAVGAVQPSLGVVAWRGEPCLAGSARRRVGFCPDVPMFPQRLTAAEVLAFYAESNDQRDYRARMKYLVEALDLGHVLEKKVETMSRGTLQRVNVAAVLLGQPALIICDETFAPLDPVAQRQLKDVLRAEAQRGAAVIVSSHHLDQLVRTAEDVIILADGRVRRHARAVLLRSRDVAFSLRARVDGATLERLLQLRPDAWVTDEKVWVPSLESDGDGRKWLESLATVTGTAVEWSVCAFSPEGFFLDAIRSSR